MDAVELIEPGSEQAPAGPPPDPRRGVGRRRPTPPAWAPRSRPVLTPADLIGPTDGPGRARHRQRPGDVLRAAGLSQPRPAGVILTGCGLLILALMAYLYLFTGLSAQRMQAQLFQAIDTDQAATYNLASGQLPAQGRPVAVLEIPALHLVQAVVEGTDAEDLRAGPGHMPTTSLPGEPGNAVIAGRRATYGAPFGALGSLRRGDVVKVVDGYGSFRYRVQRVETVAAGHHDVVTRTPGNHLTLVTADSTLVPDGRLAVVAALEGKPAPGTKAPAFDVPTSQLGLVGDPSAGLLAVGWIAVFLALLALTSWLLRRWSQPVVVYLLAAPLLLAVALFVGQSVAGFLPATV